MSVPEWSSQLPGPILSRVEIEIIEAGLATGLNPGNCLALDVSIRTVDNSTSAISSQNGAKEPGRLLIGRWITASLPRGFQLLHLPEPQPA